MNSLIARLISVILAQAILVVSGTHEAQAGSYILEFLARRDRKAQYRMEIPWAGLLGPRLEKGTQSGLYEQKLDHSARGSRSVFKQRYYVNSDHAEGEAAPVLFVICGEAACSEGALNGAVEAHARKLKAHRIALEHRYYGESQPFASLTPENLRHLTTENALADLEAFQEFVQQTLGLRGPWVAIGGSYPGSLSAYYRALHPEKVVGALASSAPVRAHENFEEYDLHVAREAGPECGQAMREAVAVIDAAFGDHARLEALKARFDAAGLRDPLDFVYLVADMGALAVQYGYRDQFCRMLTEGDPLDGYARFAKMIFKEWGMDPVAESAQGAMRTEVDNFSKGIGLRQWFYQSCTEYGYWQNAYHDPALSVRSARINPEYHAGICRRLFGWNEPARTSEINRRYYAPLLKASTTRIFYTNGSADPWSNLSITKGSGAMVIEGAAHCDDLRKPKETDSKMLQEARARFLSLMTAWIR